MGRNSEQKSNKLCTVNEKSIIMKLIKNHYQIIESRKTDSTALQNKRKAWDGITREYNSYTNVRRRSNKQLKKFWENTKCRYKRIRKTSSADNIVLKNDAENTNDSNTTTTPTKNESTQHDETDDDVLEFEQVFVDNDHPTVARNDESADNSCTNNNANPKIDQRPEPTVDDILQPIITARLKKLEKSLEQQQELHSLHLQQMAETHMARMARETELYDLKVQQEKELQMLRIQNEQELHQKKLAEYNNSSTVSVPYPIMTYKQYQQE